MSTNVPTSRRIMYMHCHVNEVFLRTMVGYAEFHVMCSGS
uniref:Uncharacterized protein n=1 Tax=Vitis vinifera TaxID=29760 RepID=F6GWR7_VITVI